MICALEQQSWSGPINATAPEPVTNREFSHALGRALHRPSFFPVPGVALRLLYGEMAQIVTTGVRAVPAKPLVLGYRFDKADLHQALSLALS
jgi:NAD dependent epimerase/dehydratase family enzyme